MKKKEISEERKKYDKSQVFVKVTAGILAALMIVGTVSTLVYALVF